MQKNLERFQGKGMSVADTQRVAGIMGISADRGLAAIFGKRGAEFDVNVDVRGLHIPALENLTTEELRALVQQGQPVEAEVVSVDGVATPVTRI